MEAAQPMEIIPQRGGTKPLVSFILLAYNQESLIGPAMDSAVNQDYWPLEIVFSDDCSSDGTFRAMLNFVDSYKGPHHIRLVRNHLNLGVANHVITRAREARGKILVLAAGDDISKAHRVSTIVPAFEDNRVWATTSEYDEIDENGRLTGVTKNYPVVYDSQGRISGLRYLRGFDSNLIQGSTSAYHKDFFSVDFPPGNLELPEDRLFQLLIYTHGRTVAPIDGSLILYRQHEAAVSHDGSKGRRQLSRRPAEIRAGAKRALRGFRSILWIASNSPQGGLINKQVIRWLVFRTTLAALLPYLVWLRNLILRAFYEIWNK